MDNKIKNTNTKKISKKKLFKKTLIIENVDLQGILSNIPESENDSIHSNNKNNEMYNVLFEENKFKIRDDFDNKHCIEFLQEKEKYFQPMNLDDSISDNAEKTEVLKRTPTKFTFGHY